MEEYRDIVEVRRVYQESEANDLLRDGWDLLAVVTGQDEDHFPTVRYVLGKPHCEEHDVQYL